MTTERKKEIREQLNNLTEEFYATLDERRETLRGHWYGAIANDLRDCVKLLDNLIERDPE